MQKKVKLIDKYKKIDSSSNFHELVRKILIEDPYFKNLKCYQEVPVSYLVPGYTHNNHHIDWYIEELRTIIELHGNQHYKRTNFGNKPYLQSVYDFNNIKYRDNMKKTALLQNDFEYIEIPYSFMKKLNSNTLKQIIFYQEE